MDSKIKILATSKVILCNEAIIKADDEEKGSGLNFLKLRHPKLGTAAMYLIGDEGKVFEVMQMNDGFRSWFADHTIIRDGSLYMTSQMNPVYLILPYLTKSNNILKFVQLADILEDEEFPQLKNLSSSSFIDLAKVTDSKMDDEIIYYRFNKERTLKWLEKRIHFIKKYLKENKIEINPPASIADLITDVSVQDPKESEYLLYSFGMLSEYLDDQMANDLYEHLKFEELDGNEDSNKTSPPNKKIKMDELVFKDPDHLLYATESKKVEKMTATQRRLSKVDKQGMKNISSFFTAEAKNRK